MIQDTLFGHYITEWDKALVCPELCPVRHGSRIRDSPRVSQTVLSPEARFGTRAVCPKPCPGMVWDKARFGTQQCRPRAIEMEMGTTPMLCTDFFGVETTRYFRKCDESHRMVFRYVSNHADFNAFRSK
ncbi:hypothetical protein Bbelb_110230 [Branchiostoma belcheri]|nr:hypothetical protein Bbelb_110230 [Branchiostoma belcheri]